MLCSVVSTKPVPLCCNFHFCKVYGFNSRIQSVFRGGQDCWALLRLCWNKRQINNKMFCQIRMKQSHPFINNLQECVPLVLSHGGGKNEILKGSQCQPPLTTDGWTYSVQLFMELRKKNWTIWGPIIQQKQQKFQSLVKKIVLKATLRNIAPKKQNIRAFIMAVFICKNVKSCKRWMHVSKVNVG